MLFEKLKEQKPKADRVTEEVQLTVESMRSGSPTSNGLKRVIIKFKELDREQWILNDQLSGLISTGTKCDCTITENGEYINFLSVRGKEYTENMQFAAKERLPFQL